VVGMYSVLPVQSAVVFLPVAATATQSLHTTSLSNHFDERYSPFTAESVDFAAAQLQPSAPPSVAAASPARSADGRGDCSVGSPRTLAAERSTPLKPAKRDRAENDDDRQILRCKRSLVSSLKTATTSHLNGGSQLAQSSTSTFTASESVERRNLRERRRVKLINVTFATLRNRLPSYCWQQQQRRHHDHHHQQQQQRRDHRPRDDDSAAERHGTKRPSKVDTLRTAISYIRCLQDLLADDDRQRMSTFQTFDAAATTDTIVPDCHWTTSPRTAADYDRCSPATSASTSLSEDLTSSATWTAALTSTYLNNNDNLVFTDDETRDRDVTVSPVPDMFDWPI